MQSVAGFCDYREREMMAVRSLSSFSRVRGGRSGARPRSVRAVGGGTIHHKRASGRYVNNAAASTELAAPAPGATRFTLHAGETQVSLTIPRSAVQSLSASMGALMEVFQEKEQQHRQTRRYKPLEYKADAGETNAPVRLEVFCNPNMHTSALNATALVSVTTHEVRVVTECALSALQATVDDSLSEVAVE